MPILFNHAEATTNVKLNIRTIINTSTFPLRQMLKLYGIECVHPSEHTVQAAMFGAAIKETLCTNAK
jgi:hypothetical protein